MFDLCGLFWGYSGLFSECTGLFWECVLDGQVFCICVGSFEDAETKYRALLIWKYGLLDGQVLSFVGFCEDIQGSFENV